MNTVDDPTFHDDRDLQWLADREPCHGDPSAAATVHALDAMLAHIDAASVPEPAPSPTHAPASVPPRRPRGPRRRVARTGALALAAGVAAVVVTAGLSSLPSGSAQHHGPLSPLAPHDAQAAPLRRLTHALSIAPPATGDATLTTKHTVSGGTTHVSYDLVTDGSLLDYFSDTRDGLTTADPTAGNPDPSDTTGPGTIHAWLAAAAAASADSPAEAAKRINDASGIPIPAAPAGKDPAVFHQDQFANHVWITALSTIELDGGRPDILAGALLAVQGIGASVQQTTEQGRALLVITVHEAVGSGPYSESITVDATTGQPVSFAGGSDLTKPDVSVHYDVARVRATDFGH